MGYKLSKFSSVAHGTHFVGRTKAEFPRCIRTEIRKAKRSFVNVH